jgi:glyoxylase-like metal-dependent hydrolase (beta-lactamase superfamily II)
MKKNRDFNLKKIIVPLLIHLLGKEIAHPRLFLLRCRIGYRRFKKSIDKRFPEELIALAAMPLWMYINLKKVLGAEKAFEILRIPALYNILKGDYAMIQKIECNSIRKKIRTAAIIIGSVLLLSLSGCSNKALLDKYIYVQTSFTKDFLLPCTGGYLLIDTSYPDRFCEFEEKLKEKNIDISEIKYILLTHHHDDHAGFAAELIRKTGARLIVHKDALPFLKKGIPEDTMKPLNWCTQACFSVFSIFKKRADHGFPPFAVRKNDIIVTGDNSKILPAIGVDGTILHTPGHTDDSISVVLSDGSAFVGDLAMDLLNFCRCKQRPIYLNDIGQVYHGWQKLIENGAKWIYPAHGDPFSVDDLKSTMHDYPLKR